MNAPSADATRVEGTPTGGFGRGANWTADLTHKAPHSAVSSKRPAPRAGACPRLPRRPIARHAWLGQALAVPEELIDRNEVVALLFNVADIATAAIGIETLLREEDGGEEEADEG